MSPNLKINRILVWAIKYSVASRLEKNKELSENALATLTRLIINRDCNILLNAGLALLCDP